MSIKLLDIRIAGRACSIPYRFGRVSRLQDCEACSSSQLGRTCSWSTYWYHVIRYRESWSNGVCATLFLSSFRAKGRLTLMDLLSKAMLLVLVSSAVALCQTVPSHDRQFFFAY